ncbi:MAG: hypothetical protein NZ894_06030, partial [Archaeoglobaceae archaeon]|nr:hypothetical protein [Archaeoglobaceae archaeon]
IKCGNAVEVFERKITLNRTFFIGEKVEILANFKPKKSFLVFENKEIPFDFIEKNGSWVYEFVAENVGFYKVVVDGIEKNFSIDSCDLEAFISDGKVYGKVSTKFTDLREILVLPMNISVEVVDGKFEVPLLGEEFELICKNKVLKIRPYSDFKTLEFDGMIFNFSIDKGGFKELNFDGELL